MMWKKDDQGNEYTTAAGAARYIGMPRTTFLHYLDPKCALPVDKRPKSKILFFKSVFYKNDLDEWKNKTSKIKFNYKRNVDKSGSNLSNVTEFPKESNKSS